MKSSVVMYLPFPKDIIDIICRFTFYTLSECIEIIKNKYKNVVKELNYVERFQYYGFQYHTGIYYQIQINMVTTQANVVENLYKEINIGICIKCGKFIKNTHTNCLCKC